MTPRADSDARRASARSAARRPAPRRRSPAAPRPFARTFLVALAVVLIGYAHAPLFAEGFAGDDLRRLARTAELAHPDAFPGVEHGSAVDRLYAVPGAERHPLAGLSLVVSSWLWSDRGTWSAAAPFGLRAENLAILLLAAWGLGAFVARCLRPWTGRDQATAAGVATGLLCALHPLAQAALATPAARGELLALALGAAAAAAFLRGRQEREYGTTVFAGVLTILAGLAGGPTVFLPFVLAVAELLSAHRWRPLRVRARTAATTLAVFSACAALDPLLHVALFGAARPSGLLATLAAVDGPRELGRALVLTSEKLGLLCLPVDAHGMGLVGFGLAGLAFLGALQPAFVAARSAPRLWGRFLLAWAGFLVAFALPDLFTRVTPRDLGAARVLLPAAAVMALGLGVAATSLSGARRRVLPWAVAAAFALLAHANAWPGARAARAAEAFRSDLARAQEFYGAHTPLLVVEPPARSDGADPLGAEPSDLAGLLHPSWTGLPARPAGAWVRGLSMPALSFLVREDGLAALRRQPLVLVFPSDLLEARPRERVEPRPRRAVLLPTPRPSVGARTWYRDGRSEQLDLEALGTTALVVRAAESAETESPPTVGWRATAEISRERRHRGAWVQRGPEPRAVFDFTTSLSWLVGDRVRLIWPESGWQEIVEAQVLDALPDLGPCEPEVRGDDWVLRPAAVATDEEPGSWVLQLLDPDTLGLVEVEVLEGADGSVVAPGVEALARSRGERGAPPLRWSLARRVDGVDVARALGRAGEVEGARAGDAAIEPVEAASEDG